MQDLVFGSGASGDAAAILESPRLRRGSNHTGGSVAAAAHPRVKCPRCDSFDTKFCYYNNYNLSQPRHFCKSCRRYWTRGGALRNVPIGGASRKPRRSSSSSSSSSGLSKPPRPKSRKVDVEGYDDEDHRSEGSTLAAPAKSDVPIFSAAAAGNLAGGFDCGAPLLGDDLPSFCFGADDRQMPSIDHPTVLDPPQLWSGSSFLDGAHIDPQVGGGLWGENQWVDEGDPYLFLP